MEASSSLLRVSRARVLRVLPGLQGQLGRRRVLQVRVSLPLSHLFIFIEN